MFKDVQSHPNILDLQIILFSHTRSKSLRRCSLCPKKTVNQGILVIFHLFQWWVYQPDILLPGSVTELQGEIKEATKRLSDLQKSSNEFKMDRQALGPWELWGGGLGKAIGRSVAFWMVKHGPKW